MTSDVEEGHKDEGGWYTEEMQYTATAVVTSCS